MKVTNDWLMLLTMKQEYELEIKLGTRAENEAQKESRTNSLLIPNEREAISRNSCGLLLLCSPHYEITRDCEMVRSSTTFY